MSATNRGAVRREDDFYETPDWCVYRLLDYLGERVVRSLLKRMWLESAYGGGAIVRAVAVWCRRHGLEVPQWRAVDIRPEAALAAQHDKLVVSAHRGDYCRGGLDAEIRDHQFAVNLTNTPFVDAYLYAKEAIRHCDHVLFLLRLNWLGSAERRAWLEETGPSVYVLPDRPDFTGEGGDATEYAWLHWRRGRTSNEKGVLDYLDTTPLNERRAA